jgi:hypothetical protein
MWLKRLCLYFGITRSFTCFAGYGLPHEIAHGSLRITLGESTTKEQLDYVVESLITIVKRLRDMSPMYEDFASNKISSMIDERYKH